MPRIISPIRKRPSERLRDASHFCPLAHDPQNLTQTRVFNYKLFFTSLIVLSIIGSILFCGIQDTLQYLKYIVLLGILLIILVSIIKS
jgi:hypothetical protein